MDAEAEAQKRCDIATAKLGVAEELRFAVAIPCAFAIYLKYDSWIVSIILGVMVFFLVTYWYEKEYDAVHDAYERLTGTGKHWKNPQSNDPT
jgi:hypothetical protein